MGNVKQSKAGKSSEGEEEEAEEESDEDDESCAIMLPTTNSGSVEAVMCSAKLSAGSEVPWNFSAVDLTKDPSEITAEVRHPAITMQTGLMYPTMAVTYVHVHDCARFFMWLNM